MKCMQVVGGTLSAMLLWVFCGWSIAQEPPVTPDPTVQPPPAAANDKPLREQTIYIPFNKLRETFEKEGRGVFLPYEKFQELWRQARQSQQQQPDKQPPLGVVISEIESEASIERDVMVVKAKLKLEILGKGWHEAPLRLADAAIRSAKIGDESARIVFDEKVGYKLLVRNETNESKQLELALEYARAFEKSPGLNTVAFAAPQAPINRWRIRIPQKGVKVNVHPLIAATEVPAGAAPMPVAPMPAPPMPAAPAADETIVLAFVGAAPEVRIDWTPKAEGATGLEALATAQVQQETLIEEGVHRTRVRLTYEISRAELPQLLVEVPADQKVTAVVDANVRQWEVALRDDKQTITIQLFEPAKSAQSVTIEMERFVDQMMMSEAAVPVVKAMGVGRQQGVVVVRIGEELRAEPTKRSGLLQVDAAELPQALQGQPWTFAYRYAALPFELVFRVEKVKPRIRTDELVEAYLEPEQITLNLLALFDIQQAGVFQLEFDLPAGFDVRAVRGQAAAGAEAAAVDAHSLEGENKTRLKVNLARKAIGRVGVIVELEKRLTDPNLLSPTGQTSALAVPLPRTAIPVEGTQGRVILYAPESLRINVDKQTGVRAVAFAEAMQGVESQRRDRFTQLREVLAFVYTVDPVDLSASVERRKPQISARQLLTARIESGVVNYDATFQFDVLYSSVKSLRIDIPTAIAGVIHNVSPGIREKTIDPKPADAAEGYTPWSFTGERELLGPVTIKLTWEQKIQELDVGKSLDLALPILKPRDVDRAWGQIVVTKAETLDVNAKSGFVGLRPIDAQHDLMDGVQIADAARAFEFHEDWSLSMTATRYELEDVKRTSIERAAIRMVVTRSNNISVQALYRVRSAVQRLLVTFPEGAQFDTDPARINGRAVALERGDKDEMYVPLANQPPDQAYVIELRYTVPGNHTRLDFPVFPAQPPVQSEPAVQKVYLLAYLPEEMAVVGSRGPWTSEQAGWYERLNAIPESQDPRQLINWVSERIPLQNNPVDSFPTDGRLYVFTTLRPAAPPTGSLHLVAWNNRWLNVLLFGGLAVLGITMVRRPPLAKLTALAVLVTALVLIGVFSPTFAMQILDAWLLVAIGLVLFVWIIGTVILSASKWMPAAAPAPAAAGVTGVSVTPSPASSETPPTSPTPASPPSSASSPEAESSGTPFAPTDTPPPDDSSGDKGQGGQSHG